MDDEAVDLVVDLNTMDETGLPWAFLDEAPHPGPVVPARTSLLVLVRARARGSGVRRAIVAPNPLGGSKRVVSPGRDR